MLAAQLYDDRYICFVFNKFSDFFCTGIYNCRSLFKIQYIIAIHLMKGLTPFFDFSFRVMRLRF